MHTILGCLSKFSTSLAYKSIYTFFVKKYFIHFSSKFPGTPTKNEKNFIHFSSAVPTKNVKTAKKVHLYIFRSLYIFRCITAPYYNQIRPLNIVISSVETTELKLTYLKIEITILRFHRVMKNISLV